MKKGKLIKVVCLQCVIMAYGMPACYPTASSERTINARPLLRKDLSPASAYKRSQGCAAAPSTPTTTTTTTNTTARHGRRTRLSHWPSERWRRRPPRRSQIIKKKQLMSLLNSRASRNATYGDPDPSSGADEA
ncbi:hypothetical protein IWX92DRAFT_229667 [Phyllosticta citricarpa]